MSTKLIVYTLLFDVILALMVGAYAGIAPPSIPPIPSQTQAQLIATAIVWAPGIPSFTLIPQFTLIPSFNFFGYQVPGVTIPAVTIPAVTFFSINFGFMWPLFYVAFLIIWIFSVLASVVGWLMSVFGSSIGLLAGVQVLGPFLSAFVLIVNFVLIWELIKLIRGTQG
jgi:hypothetical protein